MVLNEGLLVLDGPRDEILAKLNQRPQQAAMPKAQGLQS
jgi:hypothetical protein